MSDTTSVSETYPSRTAPADAVPAKVKGREYIAYIEYFRAVAIMVIVAGHTYALSWSHFISEDPQTTVSWLNVLLALITGGTAYFVFISGFLYRQVFYGRTSYGDFLAKKALYVFLPYLVLATPLIFVEIASGSFTVTVAKDGVSYGSSDFVSYVTMLMTGRVVTAYWYIPFIAIVFLATPLFDRFIELGKGWRIAAMAASIAVALWVVRPADNLNPIHSFLYFANFYLFGIVFCENRKAIMDFINRPLVMVGLALALFEAAAYQAMVLHIPGNLERLPTDGWGPVGVDLMVLQKYIGILLACAVLQRWGSHFAQPLKFVADHSFGLFFTHGIVIAVLMRMPEPLSPHFGEPIADLALYATMVFAISLAIVVIVKFLTGRYSRYIIGC